MIRNVSCNISVKAPISSGSDGEGLGDRKETRQTVLLAVHQADFHIALMISNASNPTDCPYDQRYIQHTVVV